MDGMMNPKVMDILREDLRGVFPAPQEYTGDKMLQEGIIITLNMDMMIRDMNRSSITWEGKMITPKHEVWMVPQVLYP